MAKTTVSPEVVKKLYKQVLLEVLAAARIHKAEIGDDADRITKAFEATIPRSVPPEFANQIESQEVRDSLRADAARRLFAVCEQMPVPRGPFVAAVAKAAQDKIK